MAEISDLTITDASNTVRFPEAQAPSSVNDGARALEGLIARGLKDIIDGGVTTAGTTTAYTVAANRTLGAYYDGLMMCVDWDQTCGASPTVNVDSLGAKNLVWPDGTAVASGELVADSKSLIIYDGTSFQVLTVTGTPVTPASTTTFTNKTLGASTLSGTMSAADNIIDQPVLRDYGLTPNIIDSIGGDTQDIDFESGNYVRCVVDTSETTFTFSNPPASGTYGSFTMKITNGGSQTVNWPASVLWPGGSAPTLTTSGIDILTFFTDDGGTIWHGLINGQALA